MEEFFTTVLTELEKEVIDDDGLLSPIIQQFWGKETIVRKFLHTNNGKCENCQIAADIVPIVHKLEYADQRWL